MDCSLGMVFSGMDPFLLPAPLALKTGVMVTEWWCIMEFMLPSMITSSLHPDLGDVRHVARYTGGASVDILPLERPNRVVLNAVDL